MKLQSGAAWLQDPSPNEPLTMLMSAPPGAIVVTVVGGAVVVAGTAEVVVVGTTVVVVVSAAVVEVVSKSSAAGISSPTVPLAAASICIPPSSPVATTAMPVTARAVAHRAARVDQGTNRPTRRAPPTSARP